MTRQDIVDDPAAAYPQLHQLMSAYFHRDWPMDGNGWEKVVDDFVLESPGSVVTDTAGELRGLLAAGLDDGELSFVITRLGGEVDPAAFHMSTTGWLTAVGLRLASGD